MLSVKSNSGGMRAPVLAALGFLLAAAGTAQADVTFVQDKSFSCGTCTIHFDSDQLNTKTINGSNNDNIHVTYTSTDFLDGKQAGQATITAHAKNATFSNLTIDADQNYAAETFSLTGGKDGATVNIVVTTDTAETFSLIGWVLGPGQNKLEILTSLGELIDKVVITVTAGGLDTFKQDRIAGQLSQVPLPPALVLFGSGLLGMIALGRRRLKRDQAMA
jgi:hypothetical protein